MNETPSSLTEPTAGANANPELTEAQLLNTLTEILKKDTKDKIPFESLTPYTQRLTQPVLVSLLSSETLAQLPNTLLSFYKWAQVHLQPPLRQSPLPLLSLLPSLLRCYKFADAKSLLVSFINSDRQHVLHSYLTNPQKWDAWKKGYKSLKPLLDTCIPAYVECGKPHLAAQVFNKMKKLRVKPNSLICYTLIHALVKHPSTHSILPANQVFSWSET